MIYTWDNNYIVGMSHCLNAPNLVAMHQSQTRNAPTMYSQCTTFGRNATGSSDFTIVKQVKTLHFIVCKPMYIIYNTIIDITVSHIKCIINIETMFRLRILCVIFVRLYNL